MNKIVILFVLIICAILIIGIINFGEVSQIEPEPNNAFFKLEFGNLIEANRGSYSWNDKETYVIADSISPVEMDYAITLDVKKDEMIYFENLEGIITNVTIYNSQKQILDTDITFDMNEKYIVVPSLVGEYIVKVDTACDKGKVWYSIKLNIHDDDKL